MELFAPRHLLIILAICLLVFGTKKLKTIGADLGGAIKGFKNAMKEGESAAEEVRSEPEAAPAAKPTPAVAAALENHDLKTKTGAAT